VLLPLGGKSMIQNIVERVKRAKLPDRCLVAIPWNEMSDFFDQDLSLERGLWADHIANVNDLIKRYYLCAKDCEADYVVRITADNPCIDPAAIDLLIDYALAKQPKGVLFTNAGDLPGSQWPDGIGAEFYSMKMLEWMNATIKSADLREHPHKYWHTMGYAEEPPCPVEWQRPGLKLDVNTQEEYERIKKIYDVFQNNTFNISDICQYLDERDFINEEKEKGIG
jgi:spore coat polysaccharide biosynthesis protein SpsF (cytidylyltransferase family)